MIKKNTIYSGGVELEKIEKLCREGLLAIKDNEGIYTLDRLKEALEHIITPKMNDKQLMECIIQVSLELTTEMEPKWQYVSARLYTLKLYDEVKKICPDIGLATVYRTVLLLEEIGIIFKLDLNDGCSRYELVHSEEVHRHHHLVCNECKAVFEVQDDLLDELEDRIENTYGFKILDHSVKFFGICSKCCEKQKGE